MSNIFDTLVELSNQTQDGVVVILPTAQYEEAAKIVKERCTFPAKSEDPIDQLHSILKKASFRERLLVEKRFVYGSLMVCDGGEYKYQKDRVLEIYDRIEVAVRVFRDELRNAVGLDSDVDDN